MSARFNKTGSGRSRRVAMAGGVALATIAGFADPAAAANTFTSEWSDATWTTVGDLASVAQMAPGEDNHNGATTEILVTKITGKFCVRGALLEANLEETESAVDLAGVLVDTFHAKPRATVNRTTSIAGTITRTPASGKTCATLTGLPVTTTDPTITLTGSWAKPRTATLSTYSGEDCGGTGTCRFTDATATGSFTFGGSTVTLGGRGGGMTTNQWLWSGSWDLNATCSSLPGYECS